MRGGDEAELETLAVCISVCVRVCVCAFSYQGSTA